MRLTSLSLQGFKSFPEKTTLPFGEGMTVVVGPNGSGKSNIADAVRFVLGEVSSRTMRAERMEEVIFAGSARRPAMSFARVSLTFDNTKGEISLPLAFESVKITREVTRSGSSGYFINDKPVRARDLRDLFLNTGLGKSGYSIIGQGRVDEIISERPESRRGIFEEAAGVARFRAQKEEAERKLEQTEENLCRVGDILAELEGRVEPLSREAERARRYLSLCEEKKRADVSLWLFELEGILAEGEDLRGRIALAAQALSMADDALSALAARGENARASLAAARERASSLEERQNERTERYHELESSEQLLNRDLTHLKEERARLTAELTEREREEEEAREALAAQEEKEASAAAALAAARAELTERESALAAAREEISAREQILAAAREARAAAEEQILAAKLALSSLTGSGEGEERLRGQLAEQEEALSAHLADLSRAIAASEETLAAYERRAEETSAREQTLAARLLEREAGEKTAREEISRLEREKLSRAARADALRRMEEHFEGASGAVRFVLERAKRGALPGVRGTVSQLLTVAPAHALAIEKALGGSLQNIVVEDEEAAKAAIRLLARERAGRATFYPLTALHPEPLRADRARLSSCRGFIGVASELISFDERDRPAVEFLLARTVLCETLDDASALARAFDHRFRVVSLDGQVIGAGGSYTGGYAGRESGALTRRATISTLESEIAELDRSIAAQKAALSKQEREAEKIKSDLSSLRAEREMLASLRAAQSAAQAAKEEEATRAREEKQRLSQRLENLSREGEQRARGAREAEERLARQLAEQEERTLEIAREEEQCAALRAALDARVSEKNARLIRVTLAERDAAQEQSGSEEAREALAASREALARAREGILREGRREGEVREGLAQASREREGLSRELEAGKEQTLDVRESAARAERELDRLREEEGEKRRERERLFEDHTRLASREAQVAALREKYLGKLMEEYELTYEAARALGYPPLTEETKAAAAADGSRARAAIRALGAVNVGAIDEYEEVKARYDFLKAQVQDLTTSREGLRGVLASLTEEMETRFVVTFNRVRTAFSQVFADLFGGGEANLALTDPARPLESGIEITAAPPGKVVKSLALLSGGEQAFVAIALFFAILRVTPAPFCLLDEIESALDEVNVDRFASYARRYSDKTQFIVISHRRGTMEAADTLYGVTMQERGISRLLTLNVAEAEEKLGQKFH